MFNEYLPDRFVLPGQPSTRTRRTRRSATTRSARFSSSPRPAGRSATPTAGSPRTGAADHRVVYAQPGVRAVPHDLPGRSAEGRHHAQPAVDDLRNADQAARRSGVRHGVTSRIRGELVPRARTLNWLSQLADQKNNNNITGFKNARADQIMLQYQKTFDSAARTQLLQRARRHPDRGAPLDLRLDGAV